MSGTLKGKLRLTHLIRGETLHNQEISKNHEEKTPPKLAWGQNMLLQINHEMERAQMPLASLESLL